MPKKTYVLQRAIIDINKGQKELRRILEEQGNVKLDEFIITEDVAYKIGMHPDAAPERKIAAEIIQYALTKTLGDGYISVAIRGDNRCSQRSLISSALIAARRLIYQGKIEKAHLILGRLERFADELMVRIDEPQFQQLRKDFTPENYAQFKTLLGRISNGGVWDIGLVELILQANADFSIQFAAEADAFNLALSSLTAFIMDKKLAEMSADIGMTKAMLSDENNDYAVLTPGMRGSTSADRTAFLSALDLKLKLPIIRVDSVLETMHERGIKTLADAIALGNVFNLMATENDDGQIEINAFNSGGHTNLILTAEDKFYIQRELAERRVNTANPAQEKRDEHLNRMIQPEKINEAAVHLTNDKQNHLNTNYSFLWKCLSAIATVAGATLLIVGIVYSFPILIGVGFGLGLIGGYGFFSNHSQFNKKEPNTVEISDTSCGLYN